MFITYGLRNEMRKAGEMGLSCGLKKPCLFFAREKWLIPRDAQRDFSKQAELHG